MTKRDILGIAVRVIGLWFFTYAVLSIPITVQLWAMTRGGHGFLAHALISIWSSLLNLAAGAVLVLCADGIAARLIRENGDVPVAELRGWESNLFALATRIVGIVIVVQQLHSILRSLIYVMAYSHDLTGTLTRGIGDAFGNLQGRELFSKWAETGSSLAILLIGLYLLLGANHFARLIYRRQMPQTDEAADIQQDE